jgi:hypothetical protein
MEGEVAEEEVEIPAKIGMLLGDRAKAGYRITRRGDLRPSFERWDHPEPDTRQIEIQKLRHVIVGQGIVLMQDGDVVLEG